MNKPIRHGEIMLVPSGCKAWDIVPNRQIPAGKTSKHTNYIVGHSETGHHHVLEGAQFEVTEDEKKNLYFRLFEPTQIVHKKQTDKHRTLVVSKEVYKRFHDTEYDPFERIIRDVAD